LTDKNYHSFFGWLYIAKKKKKLLPNKRVPTNEAIGATQRENPSKQKAKKKKKNHYSLIIFGY
jgi:hypothetical protein